ncbi:MAG: ATP-binding protein [Coleofasciculaceae cyanobacterium]
MSQTELPKDLESPEIEANGNFLEMPESRERLMPASAVPNSLVASPTNQDNPPFSDQEAELMEVAKLKEDLRKSEERYRCLVEAIAQINWDTNAAGELINEQPRWAAFTGQSYQEYQGWGWLNAIHPEDQAMTAKVWQEALVNRSIYEIEYRVRRYDGEYRYLNGRAVPIVEANGRIREWVGVNIDITESKQIQTARDCALAQAEAARNQLQTVFVQTPAAIATFRGANHVIETVNPQYLKFANQDDLVGKTAREVFSASEGQNWFELLDKVYESGEAFVDKEAPLFEQKDGSEEAGFWNIVYQPLRDGEGKVYGIMTHAVEVTEQVRSRQEVEKKAEELAHLTQSLQRSNQDLDQFAYVTSHDLKAPLRAIANLSEWIEEDIADQLSEESREHLHLMRKRVHRMGALIDGILQYSRAGRVQQLTTVNVRTLLSDVIEILSPSPEILMEVEPEMPTLKTEKILLEQVFMNLLNNAIKYLQSSSPKINISVKDAGKYYQFAVQDNGLGIAPEFHHKIWGIFQRLEARDKVEGTGVGLSIVKKIVESRGGKVWVESELGKGATFYFTWLKQPQTRFNT